MRRVCSYRPVTSALVAASIVLLSPGGAHSLPPRTALILAINDVYRIEGLNYDYGGSVPGSGPPAEPLGGLARVRALRDELDRRQRDVNTATLAKVNEGLRGKMDPRERQRHRALERKLRSELGPRAGGQILFLHAGDFLFPSLLSVTERGRQMVEVMNLLTNPRPRPSVKDPLDERMIVVFGNHEFDEDRCGDNANMLRRNIETSRFVWLHTNIEFADCFGWEKGRDAQLRNETLVPIGGIPIGVFGLTTDLKWPKYVLRFNDVVQTARRATESLRRQGAEVVVALTHLPVDEDKKILDDLRGKDGPDVIVGGHDHEAMDPQTQQRYVYKADADARTASVITIEVTDDTGVAIRREQLVKLNDHRAPPDRVVHAAVAAELSKHEYRLCDDLLRSKEVARATNCLKQLLTRVGGVPLDGEESKIRRRETSLGNWLTDVKRSECKADVAFINAGSLRLNQDLPVGATIRRRHLEELFIYPAPLRRFMLKGDQLRTVLTHAVQKWPGNGRFLQVSGVAFQHVPDDTAREATTRGRVVADVTLLTPAGARPVRDTDSIVVVTSKFLVDGGDGYALPNEAGTAQPCEAPGPGPDRQRTDDLKKIVLRLLETAGADGVVTVRPPEGRICEKGSPCQPSSGQVTTTARVRPRAVIAGLGAAGVLLVVVSWGVWFTIANGESRDDDAVRDGLADRRES
jgi:2',3'-cyclic-nucleotide 2'-phosphodiesterase (5'-nucleotidase family)